MLVEAGEKVSRFHEELVRLGEENSAPLDFGLHRAPS